MGQFYIWIHPSITERSGLDGLCLVLIQKSQLRVCDILHLSKTRLNSYLNVLYSAFLTPQRVRNLDKKECVVVQCSTPKNIRQVISRHLAGQEKTARKPGPQSYKHICVLTLFIGTTLVSNEKHMLTCVCMASRSESLRASLARYTFLHQKEDENTWKRRGERSTLKP